MSCNRAVRLADKLLDEQAGLFERRIPGEALRPLPAVLQNCGGVQLTSEASKHPIGPVIFRAQHAADAETANADGIVRLVVRIWHH